MSEAEELAGLQVLIVDDDKATCLLASRSLQAAGFSTLTASDGAEALTVVRADPDRIGVIVLDVLLPRLGGFEVLELLKQDDRCKDIPVVLLTARANGEADVVRGIRAGADDHVQKPFNDKVLRAKVRALCERRAEGVLLARRLRTAEELALTDVLTGLGNRRAFDAQLAVELSFSGRHRQPVALVLFDVDEFKAVNDRFGHPEGDRVLCHVADCLRACLRASDQAYRIGGEEFGVLLRECGTKGAQATADRILAAVARGEVQLQGGQSVQVTLSGGIAVMDEDQGFRGEELLARADRALYRAKHAGRARAVLEALEAGPVSGD